MIMVMDKFYDGLAKALNGFKSTDKTRPHMMEVHKANDALYASDGYRAIKVFDSELIRVIKDEKKDVYPSTALDNILKDCRAKTVKVGSINHELFTTFGSSKHRFFTMHLMPECAIDVSFSKNQIVGETGHVYLNPALFKPLEAILKLGITLDVYYSGNADPLYLIPNSEDGLGVEIMIMPMRA